MNEELDPWRMHISEFRIMCAQITVLPGDGEMVVKNGLNLLVKEGREEALRDDEQGKPAPSVLGYFCRVTMDGAEEPQAWTGEDARIVISGVHENGFRIIIAGPGAFGWDDRGSLELEFEATPQMKVVADAAAVRG